MDNLDFFLGDRVHTFTRSRHRGKVTIRWIVIERWEERMGRSLNCGVERTYTLKKCLGVSAIEREDLESTVKASIGVKSIGELKSEVKTKIGRELRLEESIEEEEEFHFQAPKCGRITLRVFQFKRVHEFSYTDNRFWLWRKASFAKTITEWTNYLYDNSVVIDTDPSCNCQPDPGSEIEGFVNLDLGRFAMLVAYKHDENGLEFPALRLTFPGKTIEQVLFTRLLLHRGLIPEHLLFLAGEDAITFTAQFLPYGSEWLRKPSPVKLDQSEQTKAVQRWMKSKGEQSATNNLISLLIGGGIGAILSVLFAPKSGKKVRRDMADATRRGIDAAGRAYQRASDRVVDAYVTVVDTIRDERPATASQVGYHKATLVGEVGASAEGEEA